MISRLLLSTALVLGCAGASWAAPTVSVPMTLITADGVGAPVGTVTLADSPAGLVLTPALTGLPPGVHGFHLHTNPSCAPQPQADGKATPGMAAGGHYDPQGTGKHLGPAGSGHLGDLPDLTVAADGSAKTPVTAAHVKLADVAGRSLMIHAGGDNYSDDPKPAGGGGLRIACGVIP
jgi:Cu-Zn family superoxide dismutase